MVDLQIADLKLAIVFVIKASRAMRVSLVHKGDNTRETKDCDVGRPIKGQCISVLRRASIVLEWGMRVWLAADE